MLLIKKSKHSRLAKGSLKISHINYGEGKCPCNRKQHALLKMVVIDYGDDCDCAADGICAGIVAKQRYIGEAIGCI